MIPLLPPCSAMPPESEISSFLHCPKNCGRKYKHDSSLNKHLRYECGRDKRFQCPDCGKKFSQKCNLKSHAIARHRKLL